MDREQLVKIVTEAVMEHLALSKEEREEDVQGIPIGISNRHVHLSQADLDTLFGPHAALTKFRDLSQPGQFAAEQKLTLVGPKGVIENVRVLGPVRHETQVEISVSDCFRLGVRAPIRASGDLAGSAGVTLVGPKGSVTLKEGVIIAERHIHMDPGSAAIFGVKDGDRVNVRITGSRALTFSEVLVRVSDKYKLEMHVDMDEANAALLTGELTFWFRPACRFLILSYCGATCYILLWQNKIEFLHNLIGFLWLIEDLVLSIKSTHGMFKLIKVSLKKQLILAGIV